MRTPSILLLVTFLAFLVGPAARAADPGWMTAARSEQALLYEAIGTIQPRMSTTLSSKVMGNVLEVLKREGDPVSEGEVVVKIDAKDLASDLAGARAGLSETVAMVSELEKSLAAAEAQKDQAASSLNLAEMTFGRMKGLFEKKSISKQEYDQAENQLNMARSQMKAAEAQIAGISARRGTIQAKMGQAQAGINKVQTIKNLAEVTAPFAGKVTDRRIEPGMLAAPGVPLLVIEDDQHLRFEAIVPESLIASIEVGLEVPVLVDALPDRPLAGKVAEIAPSGDVLSHSFLVKIAVPVAPGLRSGMYGRGRFLQGREQVVLVPRAAVETRGQLEGLWIERAGQPIYCLIRTGRSFGDQIEVLTGLSEGERFLAEPRPKGSEPK